MAPTPAATAPASAAFRPETRRGVEGFFHVVQNTAGQWWLIDAAGRPMWVKAVHGARALPHSGDGALPRDSAVRLRTWGFNAVGVGGDGTGGEDGLAFMASADFCGAAPALGGPGLRLPDVFDPRWPATAQDHAVKMCTPLASNRKLIGWVTDDALGWAQPTPHGRPALLQLCLSLEPNFPAYHAAWEFVLALHGGRIEALGRSWGVKVANKEVVREMTRAELGVATRGYLRDEARWTREFARRYFTTTAAAVRAADPNHLLLGCRFGGHAPAAGSGPAGAPVLGACVHPAVDVAMPDWRELSVGAGAGAASPVLAGEVGWAGPEFLKLPAAARVMRLTSVEWMLRRGRTALERAARHPAVVGYVWGQWQDEPGEQPPFARGLVHGNGTEAREHTELLTEFNARAELLRRVAPPHTTP